MQVPVDSIKTVVPVVKKYYPVQVRAAKPSMVHYYQKKHKKTDPGQKNLLYHRQVHAKKETPKIVFTQGAPVPSFFDGSYAIVHNRQSGDMFYHFIIFFVLGLFAYITYLRKVFSKYFIQISGSVINIQLSNRLFRDSSALFEKVDFQLNVFFIIVSGIFMAFCFKITGILTNLSEIRLLLLSASAVGVYSFFRYVTIKMTGFFMMRGNVFDEYLHNAFIYYKVLGITLLPATIFIIFLPGHLKSYPMYAGLGFVAIMFILRILRCFQLIVGKGMLLLYAILYLCTIEILPLLLLGKYAMSFVK